MHRIERCGCHSWLTGGSAATFYAPHAYQSDDLDFVVTIWGDGNGRDALLSLGYIETQGFYRHPSSAFPVEFPKGSLMIGDDYVDEWATHHRDREVLHVLSAIDSCRDRLAAFLFWNDFAGLAQALAVAQVQRANVSLDQVRAWCERERRALPKFALRRSSRRSSVARGLYSCVRDRLWSLSVSGRASVSKACSGGAATDAAPKPR